MPWTPGLVPLSLTRDLRSSIWPNTRVSVGRCSKRRMFTRPVVITWPLSMWVTRVIGTKIERRPKTSTTRPSTRGGRSPGRSTATRSRILPTWSPAGSNTGSPDRRAAKTRVGEVLTSAEVSGTRSGWMPPCGSATTSSTCSPTGPSPGNQLAVVHGAEDLSDRAVPRAGARVQLLRDTFPVPVGDGGVRHPDLHPGGEIPFAGHPTLGTAWVLRSRGQLGTDSVIQVCTAGRIGVRFDGDRVELSATPRDLVGPVADELVAAVARRPRAVADRPGRAGLGGRLRADLRARAGRRRTPSPGRRCRPGRCRSTPG